MNMRDISIRAEEPKDYPKVYAVNIAAFNRNDEAQLVDKLRSGETFVDGLSMVATIGDDVVGHILFTKIDIVEGDMRNESLALAPMAVLPHYQDKGIGSMLVQEGLTKVQAMGYTSVIVLGHEKFYPKFGFVPANKWNIRPPFNVPETLFMGLELKEGALKNIHGVVQYPSAFGV